MMHKLIICIAQWYGKFLLFTGTARGMLFSDSVLCKLGFGLQCERKQAGDDLCFGVTVSSLTETDVMFEILVGIGHGCGIKK